MRFDPVGIWEARLRDAPAASAAEAILTALLGYRDSHLLHADDVAQLASALEAWGTLVLNGNRADGSPYVPPTEGERASAQASLVARAHMRRPIDPYEHGYWDRVHGHPRPADKGWAQTGWDECNAELAAEHTGAPDA